MKSTREELLDFLGRSGESSVAAIASQLAIAGPAVRRHLEILAAERLVDSRVERGHMGRPHYLYRLTDEAKSRAANGYPRLVERLIQEVSGLDEQEGAAHGLLELLLERMGDRLAADHRTEVRGVTIEERSASLITALAPEGILDGIELHVDGVHLVNSSCPYRRATVLSDAVCRSELRAIESLLQTPVEQVARIADGDSRCEYHVCSTDTPTAASVA